MIDGCEVLDESDCDDDGDMDDIDDGNDDNLLKEIREDDRDDDIDKDSDENQEEGESVQEENNFRNLLQTTRYGRTCRTWRGRAGAADYPWIGTIFLLLFASSSYWYAQFVHSSSWVEGRNSISDSGAVNGFLYLVKHWFL